MRFGPAIASLAALFAGFAHAAAATVQAGKPPQLIVVISIDQFSGDLFTEYRARYTGGMNRLASGAVFPRAYQAHALTDTCPGHSTILTGAHPSRTGIVANLWYDAAASRADKVIYCTEDENIAGSDSRNYRASAVHLRVPTLGDRLKEADPATRVVSVAGKDRAAILLGGHQADEVWWWGKRGFTTYDGRGPEPGVQQLNREIAETVSKAAAPLAVPEYCITKAWPVALGHDFSVGMGRFARDAGDYTAFRASPALDSATLRLATKFVDRMQLGLKGHTDILAIGLSANDVIGHRYGTGGLEMCVQQFALDQALGRLFAHLDRTGADYLAVLTADHGGHDLPERNALNARSGEQRASTLLLTSSANHALAQATGLSGELIWSEGGAGDTFVGGNLYVAAHLPAAERAKVVVAAHAYYSAQPQVAAVFTHDELANHVVSQGTPEEWNLLDRARLSFDAERSGELLVLLKPNVMSVALPHRSLAAHHGSPWDMDRRVPLLFWRKGMTPFEQPLPVETVDIVPTLAALIGLEIPDDEVDGRCLDLVVGAQDSCH